MLPHYCARRRGKCYYWKYDGNVCISAEVDGGGGELRVDAGWFVLSDGRQRLETGRWQWAGVAGERVVDEASSRSARRDAAEKLTVTDDCSSRDAITPLSVVARSLILHAIAPRDAGGRETERRTVQTSVRAASRSRRRWLRCTVAEPVAAAEQFQASLNARFDLLTASERRAIHLHRPSLCGLVYARFICIQNMLFSNVERIVSLKQCAGEMSCVKQFAPTEKAIFGYIFVTFRCITKQISFLE